MNKSCALVGLQVGKGEKEEQIAKRAGGISKWMLGRLFAQLNKEALDITQSKITPFELAEILHRLETGSLSSQTAAKLLTYLAK